MKTKINIIKVGSGQPNNGNGNDNDNGNKFYNASETQNTGNGNHNNNIGSRLGRNNSGKNNQSNSGFGSRHSSISSLLNNNNNNNNIFQNARGNSNFSKSIMWDPEELSKYNGSTVTDVLKDYYNQYKQEINESNIFLDQQIVKLESKIEIEKNLIQNHKSHKLSNNNWEIITRNKQINKLQEQIDAYKTQILNNKSELHKISHEVNKFISDIEDYKKSNENTRKKMPKPNRNIKDLIKKMKYGYNYIQTQIKLLDENSKNAKFLKNIKTLGKEKRTVRYQMKKYFKRIATSKHK